MAPPYGRGKISYEDLILEHRTIRGLKTSLYNFFEFRICYVPSFLDRDFRCGLGSCWIVSNPGQAREAVQDTWCLQGRQWGNPGNCQFSSYRQCMASAMGTDAYCGLNPMRAYGAQRRGWDRNRY